MSSSRQLAGTKQKFFARHRGDLIFGALCVALTIMLLLILSRHYLGDVFVSGGATNAISSEHSINSTDTDIPSVAAAETGESNKPTLVWFHADW